MSFFKALLRVLAIIIVIIAIIILIYAAFLALTVGLTASVTVLGITVTSWALIAVGVGLLLVASVVSPEGFKTAMKNVSSGATVIGETVGDAAGGLLSGLGKGLGFDKALPWIVGGVAAYFLLTSSDGDNVGRKDQYYDSTQRDIVEDSDLRVSRRGVYA